MSLPYTSGNLLLWVDPSEKFIYRNSNNLVSSMLNRVNGLPVVQTSASAQPTWNPTALNGTPGIVYSGSQFMRYDSIAPLFSGKTPITVIFAAQVAVSQIGVTTTAVSLGNSGSSGFNSSTAFLAAGFGTFAGVDKWDSTATFASKGDFINTDGNVHVFSQYYDGANFSVSRDFNTPSTGSASTLGSSTFDRLTLGCLGKSTESFFSNVTLGTILVYSGAGNYTDAIRYVMSTVGLSGS